MGLSKFIWDTVRARSFYSGRVKFGNWDKIKKVVPRLGGGRKRVCPDIGWFSCYLQAVERYRWPTSKVLMKNRKGISRKCLRSETARESSRCLLALACSKLADSINWSRSFHSLFVAILVMISSIGTSSVLPVTSFLPILSFRGRNGYSLGKYTGEEVERKGTDDISHDTRCYSKTVIVPL